MRRCLRAAAIRVLSRPSAIDYNEPCVIKNAIANWPAVRERRWLPVRLKALYGDRLFECGRDTHSGKAMLVTLNHFLCRTRPSSRRRFYVFDSTFDADCPELLNDYTVPALFQFGAQDAFSSSESGPSHARPDHRWLLVGHAGSGSELHTDPVQTSAWNALVFGLKEWVVIEPHVQTHPSRRIQGCSPSRAPTCDAASDLSSTDLGEMRVVDDVAPVHRWFSKCVPRLWAHARCVASSGVCSSSSSSSRLVVSSSSSTRTKTLCVC